MRRFGDLVKILGPGLLLASASIGTSHLVLSTRAGAHYGIIFFFIVLLTLILKYPLFEFGPRYASATGHSLLHGYVRQGRWAVILFLLVVLLDMFAVTGAITAVCAGLLSSVLQLNISPVLLAAVILVLTTCILIFGKFQGLDFVIKIISVVMLITIVATFVATLWEGPAVSLGEHWHSVDQLRTGGGLALMIGLIGFMPTGLEVSTLHSIWSEEQARTLGRRTTLKEALLDFKIGYLLTTITALMFVIVGAYVIYGTGERLEGNSTEFSIALLDVFTQKLGKWIYPVMAVAAFGTIYGTLVSVMDGLTRGFISGIQEIRKKPGMLNQEKNLYPTVLFASALGGFLMLTFFRGGMIRILDVVTILVFLTAPIIGFLNLRVIQSEEIPESFRPGALLIYLAYIGNVAMLITAIYYILDLMKIL